MGMILRIASSRIVGQGDIVGRSGYFSLNLSANSVMRGRLDARRTLKSLVADLRYIFELDIDPTKDMTICFQKRGRYMVGFSYLLNPKAVEEGCLAIVLPNMVDIPKSNCMLNLFEAHIKSDTVIFDYTTKEGKQNVFKFPLTGFNEKYLEQFI